MTEPASPQGEPGGLTIVPMQRMDLPEVTAIERVTFGDRWSVNAFINEMENPASCYLVASWGGKTVGYAGYWLILEEAHITTIAVHPDHRRQGIGEQLLLEIIDRSATQGAKWLTLEVRASNVAAQKLYAKYGFSALGRRKAYYQDDGEDALVMWTENIWQAAYQERLARLREELQRRPQKDTVG